MHLNIFVSQSCFIHCKGCYSFSREEEKGKTMPTKNLIDFLEFVYSSGCQKMNKKLNEVSLIEYSTRSSHLLKLTSFSLIAQTADCLWSF